MRISLPATPRLPGFLPALSRFRAARSGIAALEFALILPMMLTLYIGGIEVNDAISIKRKLNHTASALADLAAQSNSTVTAAALTDIFSAGTAIMAPYNTSLLKSAVVGVSLDANKNGKVAWASSYNGATCPAVGSSVDVPANLASANGFLVMVDASYAYTPKIGYVLTGTFNMSDRIFQQPRLGKAIAGPAC